MANGNFFEKSLRRVWRRLQTTIDEGRIATDSLVVILFFLVSAILFLLTVLMLLCCAKRPKKNGTHKDVLCKKGLFALMLARMDEFDSLTPLIVTPGTPLDPPRESTIAASSTLRGRSSSSSPPPPRRPHGGKTLIVPLTTGRYRAPPVPLLGTPDSRVTTFETGTTKSCATIPEDDEEETRVDDLLSIDRTSISCNTEVKSQRYFYPSSYNLQIPNAPPDFQLPAPLYEPPPPPNDILRPYRLKNNNDRMREEGDDRELDERRESKTIKAMDSESDSILGSPQSSLGSRSPIDTTGSLSDSFYIDSNFAQNAENDQMTDVELLAKYQLHRIEEESEHVSEERMSRGMGSDTNRQADIERNSNMMARSISQQFEMMQNRRAV